MNSVAVRYFRFHGFTLVELMVVIVILGLLAGMAMPKLMSYFGDSRVKAAGLELEIIAAALDEYKLDTGRYPSTEQGLESLMLAPEEIRGWNGPYLDKRNLLLDPWEHAYHYRFLVTDRKYVLASLGADNMEGGSREDSDIVFTAVSR